MASVFADRLCQAVKTKQTPLTVGLDPVYDKLPSEITNKRYFNDPDDASSVCDAMFEFCSKTLKIIAPFAAAVKINIGFFEPYLWQGVECYYSLITEAENLGIQTIGDVKRGDIGHTATCYASGHLKNCQLVGLEDIVAPDAITINGFAGSDGIVPFADTASRNSKGIFVWVRASNPSAAVIQDFADSTGLKMYEKLAQETAKIANQPQHIGTNGYSNIGMVIGGTSGQQTTALRKQYPNIWFLVPGFGSQGATAEDCLRFCNTDGCGALISASRSIIYAYNDEKYKSQFGNNWQKCIEQAAIDAAAQLKC